MAQASSRKIVTSLINVLRAILETFFGHNFIRCAGLRSFDREEIVLMAPVLLEIMRPGNCLMASMAALIAGYL